MFSIAKKHLLKIGLVSLSFSMIALPMQAKADDSFRLTSTQQAFINEIAPHAKKVQKEHGILASITISQAILESNWGKSQLAKKGNNLFGIKGAYNGRTIYLPTKEHNGASFVGTAAGFKAYPSWYESLADHAELFANGPSWNPNLYQDLVDQSDYRLAAKALDSTGYSSDPNYSVKLIAIIEKFGLSTYDKESQVSETQPLGTQTYAVGRMKENYILNVWNSPNDSHAKLLARFSSDFNPKIEILREAKIANNKIWYQIEFGNDSGWVNSDAVEIMYASTGKSPFKNQSLGLMTGGSTWHQELIGHEGFRREFALGDSKSKSPSFYQRFAVMSTITLVTNTKLQINL
ncbi:N-acetylmuramoyl-L-alanine amidase family protein [Listeria floridensis FSL S10-1187]|uniref:N-acetylmuramoyl-L-alanine amidase family protein n=1 Tax=Listeria floridensis FSL S10-1187 TaxID=1265817 RepID=A0ABP3AWN4_9LIST|nr:glucosaminidase domain-containing protein [Listeria floridensis]EUJ27431.1 N-acetylmuramoyl-L-alanine amidase family protein [Listeria floridensis FSL S10-1187]